MARPISLELPPRDPRVELRKRLDEAPIEHAEALLDSWESAAATARSRRVCAAARRA